jgi:hypothetical protein
VDRNIPIVPFVGEEIVASFTGRGSKQTHWAVIAEDYGVPCKLGWLRTVTDPSATMARACMANAYPALQKLNAFRFAPESGHAVQRIGWAGQFEPARGIPKLGLGVFFINKRKQPSSGPTATAVQ